VRNWIVSSVVLVITLASAGAAEASVPSAEPFPGMSAFSDIVVDPAVGSVFVSGGIGTNGIEVFNAQGNFLETLPDLPGASGMVLSPDGSELYVALADGDGIAQLNVFTLSAVTFETGADTCPRSVAVAEGLVWFGYGCADGNQSGVGTFDPDTADVHLDLIEVPADTPSVFASPKVPGSLFETDKYGDYLTKYSVTGGATPTATISVRRSIGSNFSDVAFTPDGTDIVIADAAVYYHQVLSTADLSKDGAYATAAYPTAVAINEQGLVVAGSSYSDTSIWAYAPNAPTPEATWGFDPSTQTTLAHGGLAVAGNTIYAVTQQGVPATYQLHVIQAPAPADLTLTTNQYRYRYGATVHLTAHLNSADPDQTLTVYADPAGGQAQTLITHAVNDNGYLTTTYRVTRHTRFLVQYDGGSLQGWAQATTAIAADARVTESPTGQYAIRHGVALVHHDRKPGLRVHVVPAHPGACLMVQAQQRRHHRWHSTLVRRCVLLGANSRAHITLPARPHVGDLVRIRAMWPGDRESTSTTGAWRYFRQTV
jgi:hypothetical protein